MLSCKETSRLVSEGLDRKLSLRERLAVRVHLWICNNCRGFEKQLHFLRYALRKGNNAACLPAEKSLPPEGKERIRQALKERREDESA